MNATLPLLAFCWRNCYSGNFISKSSQNLFVLIFILHKTSAPELFAVALLMRLW